MKAEPYRAADTIKRRSIAAMRLSEYVNYNATGWPLSCEPAN